MAQLTDLAAAYQLAKAHRSQPSLAMRALDLCDGEADVAAVLLGIVADNPKYSWARAVRLLLTKQYRPAGVHRCPAIACRRVVRPVPGRERCRECEETYRGWAPW